MAVGETLSSTLSDSLPQMIAQARNIREYEGTWMRTTEKQTLSDGTGLQWTEISLAQLEAQDITETQLNENPQQFADTAFSITVNMSQIMIKVTDKAYRRIASVVKAKMGVAAGLAMARKKNDDYLGTFAGFGTGASPGSGNPISFGHISAAKNRISSNVTEPSMAKVHAILHGYGWKDIWDEVVQVGTYPVPAGMTADMFAKGVQPVGMLAGTTGYEDGNIVVTSTPNARGAVHAVDGVVAVQGMTIKTETRRDPAFGGGADEIFMTDEFGFGERASGIWNFTMLHDATAPTS